MNTDSAEGMDLEKSGGVAGIASTLAALNEQALAGEAPPYEEDTPSIPSVTRADLDAAIEQGDWAAGKLTLMGIHHYYFSFTRLTFFFPEISWCHGCASCGSV